MIAWYLFLFLTSILFCSENVHLLLAANRYAVCGPDSNGDLPLHTALHNGAPLAVVKLLLDAWPDAALKAGGNSTLPLHCALRASAAPGVVRHIIAAAPTAVRLRETTVRFREGPRGATALHAALSAKPKAPELLFEVLDACPEAVRERDDDGVLPIHLAAADWPLVVVERLLAHWPESVREEEGG
jgi:ankyrin repeat protein